LNNIFYFGDKEYLLTEEQYTPLNYKNSVSLSITVTTSSLNFPALNLHSNFTS
jgi:hypothetical protein